jgi:protein-L-isoaspartate(D-aspartate) O-methyltransferase
MGDKWELSRSRMVATQLAVRGIHDQHLLAAMRHIPRHQFVPREVQHLAYTDQPLPIGENQTISQPYIVALMTQMLHLKGDEHVLEIGTGSGYQTAILCQLAARVYTLEYYPRLAGRAARVLDQLGVENVEIHVGDGSQGLPDMAPYDAILVTAAAPALPGPLRSQLDPNGGRLVIPVGSQQDQYLERVIRWDNTWKIEQTERVRFVPLVGRFGFQLPSNVCSSDQNDQSAEV